MTDRLKFEMGFEKDPDNGVGATTEESLSWGWFQIIVDGVNLCQHVVGSEVSNRVHWYLLPVLEWFVENWDSLFHETKMPSAFADATSARQGFRNFSPCRDLADDEENVAENDDEEATVYEWAARHSIRFSADGGVFPDIFFRRSRNAIEVSWGHTRVQGTASDLRFLAPAGQLLLEPRETADCVYKAIERAVDVLRQQNPTNARFLTLSKKMILLKDPRSLERASWMAGIGVSIQETEKLLTKLTNSLGQKYRALIAPPPEELVISRAPAAVLMFGSLSPTVNEEDVSSLIALLEDAAKVNFVESQLPKIEHETSNANPWEQGYALATRVRKAMSVPERPYKVDLDELLSVTGIEKKEVSLSDTKVRAISIRGKGLRPLIAINQSSKHNDSEPGLRFTLAHELCHLLFDEEEGVPLAVASGPWAAASIEKRANAFAAMFLMPIDACRSLLNVRLQGGTLDPGVISGISSAFGTGKLATLRHLTNVGLIDDDEASVIEEELVT